MDMWTSPQNARLDHIPTPLTLLTHKDHCARKVFFFYFSFNEVKGIKLILSLSVAHRQAAGQPGGFPRFEQKKLLASNFQDRARTAKSKQPIQGQPFGGRGI